MRTSLVPRVLAAVAAALTIVAPPLLATVAAARVPEMKLDLRPPVWKVGDPWPSFSIVVRVKGKGAIYFDENGVRLGVEDMSGHDLRNGCADKRSLQPVPHYVLLRSGESKVVSRWLDRCRVVQPGEKYRVFAVFADQVDSDFLGFTEKPVVPADATLIFGPVESPARVVTWPDVKEAAPGDEVARRALQLLPR